jgi:hypothetical protein
MKRINYLLLFLSIFAMACNAKMQFKQNNESQVIDNPDYLHCDPELVDQEASLLTGANWKKWQESTTDDDSSSDDETKMCKKYKNGKKVAICHIPPGNPANAHTIHVSTKALKAHLRHCAHNDSTICDYYGPCIGEDPQPTPTPGPNPTPTPGPTPTPEPTNPPGPTPTPGPNPTPTPVPTNPPGPTPTPGPTPPPHGDGECSNPDEDSSDDDDSSGDGASEDSDDNGGQGPINFDDASSDDDDSSGDGASIDEGSSDDDDSSDDGASEA